MAESGLYVGKEGATFDFEGSAVFINRNTVVRAGHPIMKGREGLFMPLVIHYDVEPEPEPEPEKRGLGRPRRGDG